MTIKIFFTKMAIHVAQTHIPASIHIVVMVSAVDNHRVAYSHVEHKLKRDRTLLLSLSGQYGFCIVTIC